MSPPRAGHRDRRSPSAHALEHLSLTQCLSLFPPFSILCKVSSSTWFCIWEKCYDFVSPVYFCPNLTCCGVSHRPLGKHRKIIYQHVVWVCLTTFSVYLDSYMCPKIVWIQCPGSFCTFLESHLFAKSCASPHANPKSLLGRRDNKYSYVLPIWTKPRGHLKATAALSLLY